MDLHSKCLRNASKCLEMRRNEGRRAEKTLDFGPALSPIARITFRAGVARGAGGEVVLTCDYHTVSSTE